jgi:translation initiation factor IF-1
MNHKFSQISRINWKKMLSAVMLSAFAIAPIVAGSTPAMADRDDWNYRGRNNHDNNKHGHGNNNRDNNYRNNDYRENRTYEGIVTNDLPGREFVLRLENGQRVQVRSEDREPRRLSSGDRVRVQGYFLRTGERDRNNTRYNESVIFRATDVQIIRNNNNDNRYGYGNNNRYGYGNDNRYGYGNNGGIWGGYGNNNRRTLTGVVTDVRSDRRVKVRIDGRDYDVESARKLSDNVRRGSRVQINGDMRGNNITNATVIADNNYNDRYNNRDSDGRTNFEFNGRVTDVDERDRQLRVRGDNGRDYSLRVDDRDELKNVRRGDRVRVRGQVRNGTAIVDDVDKI